MKLFRVSRDGGPQSKVWGLFLIEIKSLFSVAILCFEKGSREAFHSHAFNAVSWVLWGGLGERLIEYPDSTWFYWPSFRPIHTRRSTFHQVCGIGNRTWVITFRGPWSKTWQEYLPQEDHYVTLSNGRVETQPSPPSQESVNEPLSEPQ